MKYNILTFLFIFLIHSFSVEASVTKEFKVHEVEVVGRSALLDNDIKKARKLALEDALYLAALKGGAVVEGFSSVSKDTILNDQSIIKPTSSILDFKILTETQLKEHFEVRILAIVGVDQIKSNCKPKPLNLTVFKGKIFVDHSLPSHLKRSIFKWHDDFHQIMKSNLDINMVDNSDINLKDVLKSSKNPEFDYNSIINGLPEIKGGNFSLVPNFELKQLNLTKKTRHLKQNQNKIADFTIFLNFYKGPKHEFYKQLKIKESLPYRYISNFKFVQAYFSNSLEDIDKTVTNIIEKRLKEVVTDFHCTPLESILTLNQRKELTVNLGSRQGLYNRQIGIVKYGFNNTFLRKSNNVVLYVTEVMGNTSKVVPLNDEIDISRLQNMKIQFVE